MAGQLRATVAAFAFWLGCVGRFVDFVVERFRLRQADLHLAAGFIDQLFQQFRQQELLVGMILRLFALAAVEPIQQRLDRLLLPLFALTLGSIQLQQCGYYLRSLRTGEQFLGVDRVEIVGMRE